MKELQIFQSPKFGEVRVIIKTGEPWFVANDVCRVLKIANPRDALARLDADEKDDVGLTDAIGRTQKTNIVNEPGLYSLVLASRKPEAKEFKRWLTHEVIPTIRKTGSYNQQPTLRPLPTAQDVELQLKLIKARIRLSNQLLKIAAQVEDNEHKYRIQDKAAYVLTSERIIPREPMTLSEMVDNGMLYF